MLFDPQKVYSLLDLTSLNDTDNSASIDALCEKASYANYHVAAVCVYPQFVKQIAAFFRGKAVQIATVANFPFATQSIDEVKRSIGLAITDGATEIDVVFPYPIYFAGEKFRAHEFIRQCKELCGKNITLKVILEAGKLTDLPILTEVSRSAILAGADFIKTSTGKIPEGASLEAASVMLFVIKELSIALNRSIGFKASGGVRTLEQAAEFIELANQVMGMRWVTPEHFRLGASQLVDAVLAKMCC